jgi:regulator of replication initiation timing
MTVIVLGAGVDATSGIEMPLTNELIPQINDFIKNDGREIDEKLRNIIPSLRFHFDKLIKDTIERFVQDFGREITRIKEGVQTVLTNDNTLSPENQKMGQLIVAIMNKVESMKTGATLDQETAELIEEVFGENFAVTDESIIDFSKLVYTDTFKSVMRQILERSMQEPNHPILKHVYHNLLDIEDLLMNYFIGFYIDKPASIKNYIYISWMLWVYLKKKENDIYTTYSERMHEFPVYSKIPGDWQIVTFNYSSFAYFFTKENDYPALYFHGNLMNYVDIQNKTEIKIEDQEYCSLDIISFIENQLTPNINFEEDNIKYSIPEFLPPIKIKPVLSKTFIQTWYKAEQKMKEADKIIIVGYSFNKSDEHFNSILHECISKPIFIIDTNVDNVIKKMEKLYGFSSNSYMSMSIQGHSAKRKSQLTIIQANAHEINFQEL